jgi:hypothetical protein
MEKGRLSFHQLLEASDSKYGTSGGLGSRRFDSTGPTTVSDDMALLRRLPGQPCRIPNRFIAQLDSGLGGCMAVEHSVSGRYGIRILI